MVDTHLFRNGRIFTGARYEEALLLEGERVVAVGSEGALRRERPSGTEVHDLAGHLLLPGLIDAHLHLGGLTRARESFDARGIGSFELLVEQLRAWARAHPAGAIVGGGWEVEQFREGRAPGREVLDRAAADRPVVLHHTSFHSAVVNSVALSRASVDRSTPDPRFGSFGRDADGTPNGLLYEEAVRSVVSIAGAESPPDPDALARTLRDLAGLGLTTAVTVHASREENAALREATAGAKAPVRVRTYLRLRDLDALTADDLRPGDWPERFSPLGVKTFADGAFGPRTAWLSEPYSDAPGEGCGVPVGTEEALSAELERAARKGLGPAVHAIGDRALERALRVVAPLIGRTRALARIEHAALTPPPLLGLLDRVRPALVVQPGFVWSDHWLPSRLGGERARWAYAFRTLLDRGHLLAGSSDAPADPVDPWRSLSACIDRRDALGRSANPETGEALPAEEAVGLYTKNGGRVIGEPDLGLLEPGARADLVVTDATDLVRAVARGAATVCETWIGGRRAHVRRPPVVSATL